MEPHMLRVPYPEGTIRPGCYTVLKAFDILTVDPEEAVVSEPVNKIIVEFDVCTCFSSQSVSQSIVKSTIININGIAVNHMHTVIESLPV